MTRLPRIMFSAGRSNGSGSRGRGIAAVVGTATPPVPSYAGGASFSSDILYDMVVAVSVVQRIVAKESSLLIDKKKVRLKEGAKPLPMCRHDRGELLYFHLHGCFDLTSHALLILRLSLSSRCTAETAVWRQLSLKQDTGTSNCQQIDFPGAPPYFEHHRR